MSFNQRHPVYTQHKLSVLQLETLLRIAKGYEPDCGAGTIKKLEDCSLIYRKAGRTINFSASMLGIEAIGEAVREGWDGD